MRLPVVQLAFGAAIVLFGAYLLGKWAVGIALALIGLALVADALLRDVQPPKPPPTATTFEDVIERARNSR